ncbi:MAG: glucosaminidase domain-containing protein [Chitinophagaceae bacterium]|nr:glucosaminidase domain-containing protein [Chitinophagaceae bacterium]
MKYLKTTIVSILLLFAVNTIAQEQNPAVLQYIETYRETAIKEMQRTGVPAAIKLAQGILETEAGRSDLVKRSNNHFGIKCKSWWSGEKVYHDDDERGECFRKYGSAADSWKDHSDYLKNTARYAFLFQLNPEDYKGWALGLKKAGYATNPRYPQILIKYIEEYHLAEFTLIALGKKPAGWTNDVAVKKAETEKQPVFIEAIASSQKDEETRENKEAIAVVNTNQNKPEPVITKKVITYPEGEFKLNDTRVVFVKRGASLLSIAEQYNIRLSWLMDFNDLKPEQEILEEDQLVFLQRKRRQGQNEFHIVEEGESLYDISQKEALRLENLLGYNQVSANMKPAAGEKLYLKSPAPERPKLETEVQHNTITPTAAIEPPSVQDNREELRKHIVQTRETLFGIARKYEVKKEDIVRWNSLTAEELKKGQELIIYKKR